MRNEFTLMEGGDYKDKGYFYKLSMLVPEISRKEVLTIHRKVHKRILISFDTSFCLTANGSYVNIKLVLFGFGIGFEIQN